MSRPVVAPEEETFQPHLPAFPNRDRLSPPFRNQEAGITHEIIELPPENRAILQGCQHASRIDDLPEPVSNQLSSQSHLYQPQSSSDEESLRSSEDEDSSLDEDYNPRFTWLADGKCYFRGQASSTKDVVQSKNLSVLFMVEVIFSPQ